jgi:ketosteroid isomerase-like protein
MMVSDSVEVVRRGYEAFNRGDWDGMVADMAPAFEYVPTGALPDVRTRYHGPEGWAEFMVGWLVDGFENPRMEIDELVEAGNQVLASVTLRGRGKQSGAEASWQVWHLWTVHDGKITHGHGFASGGEARRAAGIVE